MSERRGVSRRELFTFWRRPERSGPPRPAPLRPPGATSEAHLVETCLRCGQCIDACPADAIVALDHRYGPAAGTPAIFARLRPCVLCTELACTHACPSGALVPVARAADVAIGLAAVDETRCLAFLGQACDVCHQGCPTGAIVLEAGARVRIEATACVGCGVCESVCPTQPTSIRVVPRGS